MVYNVLHISDLHLSQNKNNYLDSKASRYIEELKKEVACLESKIDLLFLTGDIVNKGDWSEKNKATELVNHIITSLGVDKAFCVIGNHDRENCVNSSNFTEFRNCIQNIQQPELKRDWYSITRLDSQNFVLEIDQFYNGLIDVDRLSSGYLPISDIQLEQFKSDLESLQIRNDSIINILSHQPAFINPNEQTFDDKWKNRTIWLSGRAIAQAVVEATTNCVITWFAGDGHVVHSYTVPEFRLYSFISGKFNGPYDSENPLEQSPSGNGTWCQLVRIDSGNQKIVRSYSLSSSKMNFSHDSITWLSKTERLFSLTKDVNNTFSRNTNQIQLNYEIVEYIRKNKLYSLVKAKTIGGHISLGWVDAYEIMNGANVFPRFVQTACTLLKKEFNDVFSNCVIVGLGNVGTALGHYLGLCLGVPSLGIHIRGDALNESFAKIEPFSDFKKIFVTDVVSSGETFAHILKILRVNNAECLVTIVLNPIVRQQLFNVSRIIYGTDKIVFPILEADQLDDLIIPSKYDCYKNS